MFYSNRLKLVAPYITDVFLFPYTEFELVAITKSMDKQNEYITMPIAFWKPLWTYCIKRAQRPWGGQKRRSSLTDATAVGTQ